MDIIKFTQNETAIIKLLSKYTEQTGNGCLITNLIHTVKMRNEDLGIALKSLEKYGIISVNKSSVIFTEEGLFLLEPSKKLKGEISSMTIEENQRLRFLFLERLYNLSNADEIYSVDFRNISKDLKISEDVGLLIFQYLESEGLVKRETLGGMVSITHPGIKEYEHANKFPNEDTEHFSKSTIINIIGSMNYSQLQQGSNQSTQTYSYNNNDLKSIIEFINELESKINEIKELKQEEIDSLKQEIETIKALAGTKRPKNSFISESLKVIYSILEKVTISMIANGLYQQIPALIALIPK